MESDKNGEIDDDEAFKARLKKDREEAYRKNSIKEKELKEKRKEIAKKRRQEKITERLSEELEREKSSKDPTVHNVRQKFPQRQRQMLPQPNVTLKVTPTVVQKKKTPTDPRKVAQPLPKKTPKVFGNNNTVTGATKVADPSPKVALKTVKKKKTTEEKRIYEREKKRKQREKIKNDPVLHKKYLEKEQINNEKRRKEGKFKSISELSKREQRKQRKKWRVNSKNYTERQKQQKNLEQFMNDNSPPSSPGNLDVTPRQSNKKLSGRKRVRRDRSKMLRRLEEQTKQGEKKQALIEKWKKRYYKLSLKNKPSAPGSSPSPRKKVEMILKGGPGEIRKKLLFGEALRSQLTLKAKTLKTHQDKQLFYKFVSGTTLKKYKFLKEAKFLKRAEIKYRNSCNMKYNRKTNNRSITYHQRKMIKDFLEDDEHSCITPGKKDVIKRKKITKQKRYLLESLVNLHKKFCQTKFKISLASFYLYRPWWILQPKMTSRDTCLCIRHANIKFIHTKLLRLKALEEKNIRDILPKITCDVSNKSCAYRECLRCKRKRVPFCLVDIDNSSLTSYNQWVKTDKTWVKKNKVITRKIVAKQNIHCTIGNLKQLFENQLEGFQVHIHNIHHQHTTLKNLKLNCEANESVIIIDFSENYSCKYNTEVQSAHFGGAKGEITIHTGVYYTKENAKGFQFASISDSKRHDAFAVWAHLKPILYFIRQKHTEIDTIHFQSDGPTSQYRNKQNFYFFTTILPGMGYKKATWNFSEPGHGKGVADGVGGQLKRQADLEVLHGTDIMSSKDLLQAMKPKLHKIKLFEVTDDDITVIENNCKASNIKPVKNTLKIRQIYWQNSEPAVIHLRLLSCFQCETICSHYTLDPGSHVFESNSSKKKKPHQEPEECSSVEQTTFNNNEINNELQENADMKPGEWVAVIFDNTWYPGLIEQKIGDMLHVSFMQRAGPCSFSWPPKKDIQVIMQNAILSKVAPPHPISSRHFGIADHDQISDMMSN